MRTIKMFRRRTLAKQIALFLFLMLTISCHASSDTNSIFHTGYDQYQNSFLSLEDKLNQWTKFPKPRILKDLPSWQQDAYLIFEDIWTPTDYDRFVPDSTNDQEKIITPPFLLVQSTLKIRVEVDDDKYVKHNIDLFSPLIKSEEYKIIVLTEIRKKEILQFLGEPAISPKRGVYDTFRNKSERANRYQYLSKVLTITPGHWNSWNLVAFPEVLEIQFNKAQTKAVVLLRFKYGGATATYEKKNGRWLFKSCEQTWVE